MANGIDFIEKNVQTDMEARKEMMSHKLMGVPAFIIDGEAIVGLDEEKILASQK